MAKLNCWEFFECGREPGGTNVDRLGPCTTAIETDATGANHGRAAGRICWTVAGTFNEGVVTGVFAAEKPTCVLCEFHQLVAEEEGEDFILFRVSTG